MTRKRYSWKLIREVKELRGVAALLAPYLKGSRGALALGLVVTLLALGVRLAQPWPLKWILDGLTGRGPQVLSPMPAGVAFLVLAVAGAALEYWQIMILVGLGTHVVYLFRADLFRQVLRQPLAFHERKDEGELLTRIVYDATRLRKGVNKVLTRLFHTLLNFGGTVVVLFWVDPLLALVMATLGTLALVLIARGSRRIKKVARKSRRREGKLAALVAEELMTIREVQTFRPDAAEGDGFHRINAKSQKQASKLRRMSSQMLLRVELILTVGIAAILMIGAWRVRAGAMTPGELVLFVGYAGSLFRPFFRFSRQAANMGTTLASADRLRRLMQREPEIVDAPDAIAVERLKGRVELRGVGLKKGRKRAGSRRWALRDVDLTVEPGQRVAVYGHNGSGKSTLLRLLLRLDDPTTGAVLLDDHDLRGLTRTSIRSRMSVVFQGSVFFGMTVLENLTLVRPDATPDEVERALEQAGASELVARMPDGVNTVLRNRGRLLSAGERQRLALARALLAQGDIWLLDEPTTGLDATGNASVVRLIEERTRGRTVLWATHDDTVASLLDRVLLMREGRVAFFGDPADFRRLAKSPLDARRPDVPSAMVVAS